MLTHDSSLSEMRNEGNWTLLHYAAYFNRTSCVSVLLRFAPHLVDAVGVNNYTPLMLAVCDDNRDVTKTLVITGADVRTKNNHGRTVFDLARDEEMLEILEQQSTGKWNILILLKL